MGMKVKCRKCKGMFDFESLTEEELCKGYLCEKCLEVTDKGEY